MQSTSNVAAEKTGPAKLSEKLAEKRRALGRGLESLLPGPRVVPPPASPTLPQSARKDGAPGPGGVGTKTNAAWASHPGRIVIADVLTAVFRHCERSSRNCTGKSAMQRCPLSLRSRFGFGVSILLGRRISEEAAKPGHRHTGHVPNFPR
jgi:hypothetical protein